MLSTNGYGVPVPDALESPDDAFQVGSGVYVAAVLTGLGILVGVALEASTAVLVATVPTTISVGIAAGCLLSARVRGLPEWIGRRRRRLAGCFLPAFGAAALTIAAIFVPAMPLRFAFAGGFATVVVLVGAVVVATMARTRYVAALTPDEPVATWRWRHTNRDKHYYAIGLVFGAIGLVTIVWGDGFLAVQWVLFSLFSVVQGLEAGGRLDGMDLDVGSSRTIREIRIHEAGLVVAGPVSTRLVPWSAVEGVALTDDELVVERAWVDVRCDRAVIDDPEEILAALERGRDRASLERH